MKPAGTFVLLAASVLLWGVIWWINGSAHDEGMGTSNGDSASGMALLRMDPETVGRIVITGGDKETVIEEEDGFWFLRKPEADRADAETVDTLLDLLSHLTILEQIPLDDIGSRSDLDPDAIGMEGENLIQVELTEKESGDSQVIYIGQPSPLENSIYARLPENRDRPDLYLVDGNPRSYLEDPVASLRDQHLFLAPTEQIVQVNLRTPKGEIEVNRQVTQPVSDWTMTRPLETRANRDRIDELLAALSALRVESVTETGKLPGATPNPVPDEDLVVELRRIGVETPLSLHFRPVEEPSEDPPATGEAPLPLIEARVSDRPAVFRLRSDLLETLPQSADAYRDPHLARIALQTVFAIGIESRGNPPVELKTARTPDGVAWYSTRNGVQESANVTQVIGLIQALNEEKILSFVSDSPTELEAYNLNPAPVTVSLGHYERIPSTAPDGAPEGSAGQLGTTRKTLRLGFQEIEGDAAGRYRMFANWLGEPYIYEISPALREKVPTHPLKWKDLRLLSFNPISLRAIERKEADSAKVRLTYDYRTDEWKAIVGENGAPPSGEELNRTSARRLLETLGSLTASAWMIPSAQAFQALQEPDTTFAVTLETVDRATGTVKSTTHKLELAKSSAEIFYGRLDDSQEVFVIDRPTYRDLIVPLFGDLVRPPR